MERRRMKIDALAAYFVNTYHEAAVDEYIGADHHWNGTMLQMLAGNAVYPVDIEDALDFRNNARIARNLIGCGIRPEYLRDLLLASAYSETRDWNKAFEMLTPLDALAGRYRGIDFGKKFYKKIKPVNVVGKKYNKATLLETFGMLYDNYEDDGTAQRDVDDRENFLPLLTGMLSLVAVLDMPNPNEAVITWMMTEDEWNYYRSFLGGINGIAFMGRVIDAGRRDREKAEGYDAEPPRIGEGYTSSTAINESIGNSYDWFQREAKCDRDGTRGWLARDFRVVDDRSAIGLVRRVLEEPSSALSKDEREAGIKIGLLNPATLQANVNPNTGRAYCAKDVERKPYFERIF